jgi:ERCC4-type nuclease
MYQVYIDCRERHLITLFEENSITFVSKSLDIGDILITYENEKVYCIIERKSVKDLNASLKDGRYKEQKQRLLNNFDKKNILYILEDYISFESLNAQKNQSVIHSTFRDEIKFIFSRNLNDTYYIIMSILDRVIKNPQYFESSSTMGSEVVKPYFNMTTIKKSTNTDMTSVHKQMFCQIPGISEQTATCLYEHYNGLHKMIISFQNKDADAIFTELNSIKVNNRKISKRVVENIIKYMT